MNSVQIRTFTTRIVAFGAVIILLMCIGTARASTHKSSYWRAHEKVQKLVSASFEPELFHALYGIEKHKFLEVLQTQSSKLDEGLLSAPEVFTAATQELNKAIPKPKQISENSQLRSQIQSGVRVHFIEKLTSNGEVSSGKDNTTQSIDSYLKRKATWKQKPLVEQRAIDTGLVSSSKVNRSAVLMIGGLTATTTGLFIAVAKKLGDLKGDVDLGVVQ